MLTSDPVLQAPKFDGTPFVLTTNGCKDGFGAVLLQEFTTTLDNGETITKLHSIGFVSKRTSLAEERYKMYVLEFVALKFGFDHFSDTIWGFPVQVKTDCIALRDMLCNDKLSLVHARWRDGISAYQITEVQHRPGKTNAAADALSWRLIGRERTAADGSSWAVSKDWESFKGLVNDMFEVSDEQTLTKLRERFREELLFSDVLDAMYNLDNNKPEWERKCARHCAMGYIVDEGKLWKVVDGKSIRARARQEAGIRRIPNTNSFVTSPPNWCLGAIFEEIAPFC